VVATGGFNCLVIADPYYQDGGQGRRDKVQELLDTSPFTRRADVLGELAQKIEVDVPTFLEEVARSCEGWSAGASRRDSA